MLPYTFSNLRTLRLLKLRTIRLLKLRTTDIDPELVTKDLY